MDESQVDQILAEWEEMRESNPSLSLDQFIEDRLKGADSELIEAFRHQAEELESIDRQMEQIAGPLATASQSPQQDGNALSESALQPGLEPIPGYTLVSQLGDGGFGKVWKAESPGGFHVALKFVPIGGRESKVEERSLEVIKDVRHPHLLSVFGTWRIDDLLIIASELADRTLLDRFLEAQKEGHEGIPREELLVYVAEAAKGIDFLNDPDKSGRMRIQHRDIKPQNLLLSGGSVKVGDFGLARSIQFDATGHTGSMTLAYAAPECFDGTTSSRSDQYSLAVTYCQLRGGRLPFEGTQVEVMEGHRKKKPDLSMLPPEERPAVEKALAKRPKDRWNSCAAFVQELASASGKNASVPSSDRSVGISAYWKWGAAATIPLLLFGSWLVNQSGTSLPSDEKQVSTIHPPKENIPDKLNEESRPRIAVLYFENQSADEKSLEPLSKGLCSMMITQLESKAEYDIVERDRLENVLEELKLTHSTVFDQTKVAEIGKLVGAQQLLLGSYFHLLDVFRIDARLVDVETGVTIAAAGVEGKPNDFSGLLTQLVNQLVEKHQGNARSDSGNEGETQPIVENSLSVSLNQVSKLGEAVNAYDRGDVDKAIVLIDALIDEQSELVVAVDLRKRWLNSQQKPKTESPQERNHEEKPK